MRIRIIFYILLISTITSCIPQGNNKNAGNTKKIIYKNIKNKFTDTLLYPINSIFITKIKVKATGKIGGEALLKFHIGTGTYDTVELKGNVKKTYYSEWYEPKCIFTYEPITEIKEGYLELEYKIK